MLTYCKRRTNGWNGGGTARPHWDFGAPFWFRPIHPKRCTAYAILRFNFCYHIEYHIGCVQVGAELHLEGSHLRFLHYRLRSKVMAEALFKAVFVTVFVVGTMSLIKGEFQGWEMVIGWFAGILVAELILKKIRKPKSIS